MLGVWRRFSCLPPITRACVTLPATVEPVVIRRPCQLQGLQMLNAVGYGREGSGLELDLVYNPNGAFLAAGQAALEEAYRAVSQVT